jgi:hypothetical protein
MDGFHPIRPITAIPTFVDKEDEDEHISFTHRRIVYPLIPDCFFNAHTLITHIIPFDLGTSRMIPKF